jgi:hypothetical protein
MPDKEEAVGNQLAVISIRLPSGSLIADRRPQDNHQSLYITLRKEPCS